MKVYLQALGCKLNESELEAWARDFAARGAELVDDPRAADTIVLNTCTVTAQASRKSRNLTRHLARVNPAAQLVLTGCYATMQPEQAGALPNVSLVVPNADKDELVRLAGAQIATDDFRVMASGCRVPEAASGELTDAWLGGAASSDVLRTRGFVKIEDGCNMSCSYCIIPLARGRARSRPQADIVREVKLLVDEGYREVILTGVQISDYRLEERQAGKGRLRGLCELVTAILSETALPRLRLTSIAPWDLEQELLDLFADSRLCRHLHLSLQSGSTTVLRRMRRPYSTDEFADAVARARASISGVAITTDVIVGFPGEADVEFQESFDFVERMKFARVHVFPYSTREGTVAARLPLHVAQSIKDARAHAMQRLAETSQTRFAKDCLGQSFQVLYEQRVGDSDVWSGYTDNYVRVLTASRENLANQIIATRLVKQDGQGVWGELAAVDAAPPAVA